jgi:hypothetical protein
MEAKDIHIQEMLPAHMGSISCMWISVWVPEDGDSGQQNRIDR